MVKIMRRMKNRTSLDWDSNYITWLKSQALKHLTTMLNYEKSNNNNTSFHVTLTYLVNAAEEIGNLFIPLMVCHSKYKWKLTLPFNGLSFQSIYRRYAPGF